MKPDFDYEYKEDGINEIIDEAQGSNTFIALREVRWNDSSDFKLDIRRYIVKPDGSTFAGKGISFATEAGPHNLANKLVEHGYGNTKNIVQTLMGRDLVGFIDGIASSVITDDELSEFKKDLDVYYNIKQKEAQSKKSAKDMLNEIFNEKD